MLSRIASVTIIAGLVTLLWLPMASVSDEFERFYAGATLIQSAGPESPRLVDPTTGKVTSRERQEYLNLLKMKAERMDDDEIQEAIQTLKDELQRQDASAEAAFQEIIENLAATSNQYRGTKAAIAAQAGLDDIREAMQRGPVPATF